MRYRISHTHSCGFISFQNARKFCLNFVGCTTPTIFRNFTRHSRSHWCFQLHTCVLDGFLEFHILGVDEIDPTQFSCVVEMNFFFSPLSASKVWLLVRRDGCIWSFPTSTRSRLSLHRHPEMSREVVEETLLILQETQYYSLFELVDAVPRWMFSVPDLLQGFWFVRLR